MKTGKFGREQERAVPTYLLIKRYAVSGDGVFRRVLRMTVGFTKGTGINIAEKEAVELGTPAATWKLAVLGTCQVELFPNVADSFQKPPGFK